MDELKTCWTFPKAKQNSDSGDNAIEADQGNVWKEGKNRLHNM